MATSSFGLRAFAYAYCRTVSHFFHLGIDGYQILLALVLLGSLCGIAFLASGQARALIDRFCPPWLFCLLLTCALFMARVPTFLPKAMNPDESMLLAGAMKLRHYPVFWQSLDGQTSGPLNYYTLTLLNLLGLPLDYSTARLLNVICIGGVIAVVYLIARLFMADWIARLTPLPPLAAAMAFRSPELLHYSSECVSALLIAVGTWLLLAQSVAHRTNWIRGVGIGLIAVLIPLAKMQAAPMAAAIAVGGIAEAFFGRQDRRWRSIFYVLAGLAAGVACLLVFLAAVGQFGTFLRSYVVMNMLQANERGPVSLGTLVRYSWSASLKWYESGILTCLIYVLGFYYYRAARRDANGKAWIPLLQTTLMAAVLYAAGDWWLHNRGALTEAIALAALVTALLTSLIIRQPASILRARFSDRFAILLLVVSLYAIYRPRTGYFHYLTFLIFPLALVGVRTLVWSLNFDQGIPSARSSSTWALRAAVLFTLFTLALPQLFRSRELLSPYRSEGSMAAAAPSLECIVCPLVQHFTKPGDPITVWGWAPELYVLTGTLPATRDTHMPSGFMIRPQQDYYRRRYLNDLQAHPPKVFLDAVGPHQFGYPNRETAGYETFPELREYVMNNFYLAGDIDGVRVFARKDAGAPFDRSSHLPSQN
jgi:hypothetical protein